MTAMDSTSYQDVPHPGEFIKEELEARSWIQRDLAYILGVPEQAVNLITSGKRGISPEMAKALGEAFDVDPALFANLQRAFEMSRARAPDPSVGKRARLQSVYPLREMIKRGWIQDAEAGLLEAQMAKFLGAANENEIPHLSYAAKKTSYDNTPPPQLAWLFRVKQIAAGMALPKYSETGLRAALPSLRALMVDPEAARHVPRILQEVGVRLVFVEGLPNSKIDGACLWLDKQSPVIGMSLRHDRIDNFWFVLRHEIEHVLQRDGQSTPIVDAELDASATGLPEFEQRANAQSAEFALPEAEVRSFITRKSPFFAERDIVGFAKRLQVHPGIVVGQIQSRTQRWDLLRRHLVKIRQHVLPGAMVDGWGQVAPVRL
jgi:HTH-type transcriptional regulator/antitoxin HigA